MTISGINLLGAIVQNGNAETTVETITTVTTITEISQSNAASLNGTSSAVVGLGTNSATMTLDCHN